MNNPKNTIQAAQLPVNKLRPFEGHPFQVKDDAEMVQLVWSILTQGLLTPITVRPLDNNEYEVISGHRRLHACKNPSMLYTLINNMETLCINQVSTSCNHLNHLVLDAKYKSIHKLLWANKYRECFWGIPGVVLYGNPVFL